MSLTMFLSYTMFDEQRVVLDI